jgi:hypothetical protein
METKAKKSTDTDLIPKADQQDGNQSVITKPKGNEKAAFMRNAWIASRTKRRMNNG